MMGWTKSRWTIKVPEKPIHLSKKKDLGHVMKKRRIDTLDLEFGTCVECCSTFHRLHLYIRWATTDWTSSIGSHIWTNAWLAKVERQQQKKEHKKKSKFLMKMMDTLRRFCGTDDEDDSLSGPDSSNSN
ncbi:hypothetical protein H5410_005018 [Solanum commersonii]|uniref:Uncharacterized protein n=1 Tax=Solanum commersonii TaxID=4109 RepID=A0A9J6A603_SOLCO|nr:hypothetical protein H5410_005018 [Solanum commersonii]